MSRVYVDLAISNATTIDASGGRTSLSGMIAARSLLASLADAPNRSAAAELTGAAMAQLDMAIARGGKA